MATVFAIVTLLVLLSSLKTTDSRDSPYRNEYSSTREQTRNEIARKETRKEDCELRRPDGTCHNNWRVGKKGKNILDLRERRQATCDRIKSPNCRVMVGRKRNEFFKRLSTYTPCDKRSANCEKLYMYKSDLKSANWATKKTQKCELKSPLCYLPFPGKRKPKNDRNDWEKRVRSEDTGSSFLQPVETSGEQGEEVDRKDSMAVMKNNLLKELPVARQVTELPYELNEGKEKKAGAAVNTLVEDNDNSKPTCDPKRDLQCRFRIFGGKRDQIFNKPTSPESYGYN